MKSEFLLAFNEIAETRKLPREVILDALSAALVSAYRRDTGISSMQGVEVRFDERTSVPSIWTEKEVVEGVHSELTEVDIADARTVDPGVEVGDMLFVDSTPADFGRIAAQTAKQVILQRMREAERDSQYQEFQERVGDLVTGTVQSHNSDVVTIGLGRAEAILPRSQQVPGERYRMHDKVRAYVMEVKKTNRGPQIVVSRTHRNMLRRLLEYEVPEIYNGAVEIKSIAREPGARSKVAVAAIQPGADPVGACVGMRGVRIQSIVKELNGEKIDVIEWNADQAQFISKSLSPARVSSVFLDDDPDEGRTATVVVPDDQLSLAIGREGQNARLAAKLTGWRIDIKSITESAVDAVSLIDDDSSYISRANIGTELLDGVRSAMLKKEENRAIMPEEFQDMVTLVKQVESERIQSLEGDRSQRRAELEDARERVPETAYDVPLDETDLPLRIYRLLDEAGYRSVGQLMYDYYATPEQLLEISGFGPAALETVGEILAVIELPEPEGEKVEEEAVDAPADSAVKETGASEIEEPETVAEAVSEEQPVEDLVEPVSAAIDEVEYWDDGDEMGRQRRADLIERMAENLDLDIAVPERSREDRPRPQREHEEGTDEAQIDGYDEYDDYDDDDGDDEESEARRRDRQRRRELVFDEDLGRVVAKRRRKRGDEDWANMGVDDLEDMEF